MPFAGTATAASTTVPLPVVRPPVSLRPLTKEHRPVSATLAANEAMAARRRRGQPVLPLAFGEAGLPAHPLLFEALASASGWTSYGPVAGRAPLREAAASYWARRGLPTDPDAIVAGPGSKALLFGLIAATGGDVASRCARLGYRTIVWTHVQFAVTEFGSPLIAMEWGSPLRVFSPADES